jgi:hypothetical protein
MSDANWEAMSYEAYGCVMSCLSTSASAKKLKGVSKGGGTALLKKLHEPKGSVEHRIQRWDSKLDRLTLVGLAGWIDFRVALGWRPTTEEIVLQRWKRTMFSLRKSFSESSTRN